VICLQEEKSRGGVFVFSLRSIVAARGEVRQLRPSQLCRPGWLAGGEEPRCLCLLSVLKCFCSHWRSEAGGGYIYGLIADAFERLLWESLAPKPRQGSSLDPRLQVTPGVSGAQGRSPGRKSPPGCTVNRFRRRALWPPHTHR